MALPQIFPKRGPYQRKPKMNAATMAKKMSFQFRTIWGWVICKRLRVDEPPGNNKV
jgi:hypothetical protein